MKKSIIIAAVVCMLNGACTANALERPPHATPESTSPEVDPICRDPQALAGALRLEEIYTKEKGPEAAAELLESLGVELLQEKGLRLNEIQRISGKCLDHLEHFKLSTYRFDTGVVLRRTDGVFVPYLKDYLWYFISSDDAHPERASHQFFRAVELDSGSVTYKNWASRFIGIWGQDGKSVVTPYRKHPHEEFVVYDNLIASKHRIFDISFWPYPHQAPGGYIDFILKESNDRIILTFDWWYRGLPIEEWD